MKQCGSVAPLALNGWDAAVDALLALGREREALLVLDAFPISWGTLRRSIP